MKNEKQSRQVQEAIDFLNDHPGVGWEGCFFSMNFTWWMVDVCKNGEYKDFYCKDPKKVEVIVYKDDPRFDELFEKFKDDDDLYDECDNVYVPYKEIYGYDWEYDHTYYRGEYCFLKYVPDEDFIKFMMTDRKIDRKKAEYLVKMRTLGYARYQGGDIKATSWERLIIKTAEDVKKKYGDFCISDFYTEEEKKSHEGRMPFLFETEEDSHCCKMVENPEYIRVSAADVNLRWIEWFKATNYYKKHWEYYL